MIFTEGTILMHKAGQGLSRDKIIEQVKKKEPSVHDFSSYIPIGSAVDKISSWQKQGAAIIYLTSRSSDKEVNDISKVIKTHNFPPGRLIYCQDNETYVDVVEQYSPDILIEDNCASIGGASEVIANNIKASAREKIKSIILPEFSGIDSLASNISELI